MKYIFIVFGFLIIACGNKEEPIISESHNCELETVSSITEYESAPKDHVTIQSIVIKENCLTIKYSASGCSGDSWIVKLIDSEAILESFPVQRNLLFSFKNEEQCEAYITKETSFNIANIKVGEGPVKLNINNTEIDVLYTY